MRQDSKENESNQPHALVDLVHDIQVLDQGFYGETHTFSNTHYLSKHESFMFFLILFYCK